MPKARKESKTDFAYIEKLMADNPDDFFSAEEADRRMTECMRRIGGQSATMNMKTGQNLNAPFLNDEELKARGYPCDAGFS